MSWLLDYHRRTCTALAFPWVCVSRFHQRFSKSHSGCVVEAVAISPAGNVTGFSATDMYLFFISAVDQTRVCAGWIVSVVSQLFCDSIDCIPPGSSVSCLLHWQAGSLPLAPPGVLNFYLFYYLFLAVLGHHCCAGFSIVAVSGATL